MKQLRRSPERVALVALIALQGFIAPGFSQEAEATPAAQEAQSSTPETPDPPPAAEPPAATGAEVENELRQIDEELEARQRAVREEREKLQRALDLLDSEEERLERQGRTLREREREQQNEERQREQERRRQQRESEREARERLREDEWRSSNKWSFGRTVRVEEGETAQSVQVMGADVEIEGHVDGDVSVAFGNAFVSGHVDGEVEAFLGDVELRPGAVVRGDVTSVGGDVRRMAGARVDGTIDEVTVGGDRWSTDREREWEERWDDRFPRSSRGPRWLSLDWILSLGWLALMVAAIYFFGCVAQLILPAQVDRVESIVSAQPLRAGVVGLALVAAFLPALVLVVVLLSITVIGIPLLIFVPFVILALGFVAIFGYNVVAVAIGRRVPLRGALRAETNYGHLLTGLFLLHLILASGFFLQIIRPLEGFGVLFCIVGGLAMFCAMAVGLGGVFLARFSGNSSSGAAATVPPPPPPSSTTYDDPLMHEDLEPLSWTDEDIATDEFESTVEEEAIEAEPDEAAQADEPASDEDQEGE